MIQSTTNTIAQKNLGFETLARFTPQSPKAPQSAPASKAEPAASGLTAEQEQAVAKLKQIDQKVRAHEQAHISVGADLIRGGASFSYTTGPDNKRYAVSGEVTIDTSPGRTPEETIPKAQHIIATALAPADPSPQDHSVAAQAGRLESRARQELLAQEAEEAASPAGSSGAALYRDVGQSDSTTSAVGSRFDLFA
ncbi:MAG: putative metalloprotease CJM1_0395 family protein [Rhodocyclaceae bacterium]